MQLWGLASLKFLKQPGSLETQGRVDAANLSMKFTG